MPKVELNLEDDELKELLLGLFELWKVNAVLNVS